jgi:predicted ATP-dependent protease
MAAYRAGIKTVIFPADNQKDLVEVPEPVRAKMTFLPVAFVDEVFQHAFAGVAERIAELEARAAKRRARIAARRKAKREKVAKRGRAVTRRKPAARAAHPRRLGRRPRARRAARPR